MYELPNNLRELYRHWEKHTKPENIKPAKSPEFDEEVLSEIELFATERMHVWHRRSRGQKSPYTADQILQKYRFCNIYRELNRQTIEIHQLLNSIRDDFDLWLLNIFFCRFVCNPQTIKEVGLLSYNDQNNKKVFDLLLKKQSPKYGSAYVFPISIIQKSKYPTRESFFCFYLPQIMRELAKVIRNFDNLSVVDAVERTIIILGFNFRFHTTEVLIDVAYQHPELINLFAKFPIGPGSAPTMKMISDEDPEHTCLTLTKHTIEEFPHLIYKNKPVLLSTENWEGIGWEFRKYLNLSKGLGRKRKYNGARGTFDLYYRK